jgi:hypothetical protein
MLLFCSVLVQVTVIWRVEREMVADQFALSHLKVAKEDGSIVDILTELLWPVPDEYRKLEKAAMSYPKTLTATWETFREMPNRHPNRERMYKASMVIERIYRLNNARRIWAINNKEYLDLLARGYDPGKPASVEIILLLAIAMLSGFMAPDPQPLFAWCLVGLDAAMVIGYVAAYFHVRARYGRIMDTWFAALSPGPDAFVNAISDIERT